MTFSQLPIATLSPILLALTLSHAAGQSASDLYRITDGVTQSRTEFHQVSVQMGHEHILADLRGPGKVTYFYITDDSVGKWYPGLVLKVYWDDATEPAIWVPLADFFGAVTGRSVDYQSAVMQIHHACFMCYFPMPFSKRARFMLANDDHNPRLQGFRAPGAKTLLFLDALCFVIGFRSRFGMLP